MHKQLITFLLFLSSLAGLQAAPVLTLNPSNGAVFGAPGATVGWGFTLTSDAERWLTVISSELLTETNPSLGVYEDYIALLGGPVNAFLAPGEPAWSLSFDALAGNGVGKFTIAQGAALGQSNSGILRVQVEAFDQDPSICGGACVTQTLQFDLPYSVTVREPEIEPIPEPATVLLTGGALALVGLLRLRRR